MLRLIMSLLVVQSVLPAEVKGQSAMDELGARLRIGGAVRAQAQQTLREIAALHPDQHPTIARLLVDPDSNVRAAGAEILGVMGVSTAAVAPILADALRDRAANVRRSALTSLIVMRSNAATAVPALMQLVRSGDPETRRLALEAVDESESVRDIPEMLLLLEDADP